MFFLKFLMYPKLFWIISSWKPRWKLSSECVEGFGSVQSVSRWWFQIFFIFIPTWGRFPFWLTFFRWGETTSQWWEWSGITQMEVTIHPWKGHLNHPKRSLGRTWSRMMTWLYTLWTSALGKAAIYFSDTGIHRGFYDSGIRCFQAISNALDPLSIL